MREIHSDAIIDTVRRLCIDSNMTLPQDLANCIATRAVAEPFPLAREMLGYLCDNLSCAKELGVPICQDTGMAVVFLELGQEVHLTGIALEEAINQGVARGYLEGNLRCSIVDDPLKRINTGDNTPAIIHLRMVAGEHLRITVAPKGFGSENMSALKMFSPAASQEDLMLFVLEQVTLAGANPCPPVVIGVGIGGNFEHCAYLAKKAVCRNITQRHPDSLYAQMEQDLLHRINQTGIGPQGFGGETTALCVNIETYPTHIAGLPIALNIGCHVTRHATHQL